MVRKTHKAVKIVTTIVAVPIAAICAATILYYFFLICVFIFGEWLYYKDEQNITERMAELTFLEFDYCLEGKCFYTYTAERKEISVSVFSPSKIDDVAERTEAVFADWSLAPSLCSSLEVDESSKKDICLVE